jgi:hypothetical protein
MINTEGEADMTLDEFAETLKMVEAGKYANVPYDVYADLFPPGGRDQGSRDRCYNFAQSRGFRIENKVDREELWFVKI